MKPVRGIASVLILVIVILILVGGTFAYLKFFKKTPAVVTEQEATSLTDKYEAETANWVLQTSAELNASFKTKPEWKVRVQPGQELTPGQKVNTGVIIESPTGERIISVAKNFSGFNGNYKLVEEEKIKISGIVANKQVFEVYDAAGKKSQDLEAHIGLEKNNVDYIFIASWRDNTREKEINQFLSTFRFE